MKQWSVILAFMVGIGVIFAPITVCADHHEKPGAVEEKNAQKEGSSSHTHDGAKKDGKAAVKKAGAPEASSSATHSHDAQGEEEEEEGSH